MKKTWNRIFYFFLCLTLISICSIGIAILAETANVEEHQKEPSALHETKTEESNNFDFGSLLSVLGGFSGGGLLLIFLIKRLVNNYDKNFADWTVRCEYCHQQQDVRSDKIKEVIEEVRKIAQDTKIEVVKLQASAADKSAVTQVTTKTAALETDLAQVRNEIKSIMSHLLK